MNKKRSINLIKIATMFLVLGLSGCGTESFIEDLPGTFAIRAQMNIKEAERLKAANLISEEDYNSIYNAIQKNLKSTGLDVSINDAEYTVYKTDDDGNQVVDDKATKKKKEEMESQAKAFLSSHNFTDSIRYCQGNNYGGNVSKGTNITTIVKAVSKYRGDAVVKEGTTEYDTKGGTLCAPFDLFSGSDDAIANLSKNCQHKLYVLKIGNSDNGSTNILEVMNAISAAKKDNYNDNNMESLDHYFIDSGRTMLDIADVKNSLIVGSKNLNNEKGWRDGGVPFPYDGYSKAEDYYGYFCEKRKDRPQGNYNVINEDLLLARVSTYTYDDAPTEYVLQNILILKMLDFNKDIVDAVTSKTGIDDRKMVVMGDKAYLMEYPVFYVKGWTAKEENGVHKFQAQYALSDLTVNLASGEVKHADGTPFYNKNNAFRYHLSTDDTMCSFILDKTPRFHLAGSADKAEEVSKAFEAAYDTQLTTTEVKRVDESNNNMTNVRVTGEDTGHYNHYLCKYGVEAFNVGSKAKMDAAQQKLSEEALKTYKDNVEKFGSIVLRDYLEYTYAPNVVGSEQLTAIGRMFRLEKFSGEGEAVIGKFVNKSGKYSDNDLSVEVKSTDLFDVMKVIDGKKHKLNLGVDSALTTANGSSESGESDDSDESDDSGESGDTTTDSNSGDAPTAGQYYDSTGIRGITTDNLECVYEDSIVSTDRFPGAIVATSDNTSLIPSGKGSSDSDGSTSTESSEETDDSDEQADDSTEQTADTTTSTNESQVYKPVMYGMGLDLDAYTSALMSGWITVEGEGDAWGSLNWWNVWLGDSGYTYTVDRDILINSLQGNYNFDITNNDRIILNINTLTKIQKMYDAQRESKMVGFIKTIFKIFGMFLIFYSILLMAAWVYDVNLLFGPRLLGFLTMGKWVGVVSTEEVPNINMDGRIYVNFKSLLITCILFISVGVVLNVIGIVDVVLMVSDFFSGIWEVIYNIVLGQ